MDPDGFSASFNVSGSQYISNKLAIGVSPATVFTPLTVHGDNEVVTVEGNDPYIQLKDAGNKIGYLRALGSDLQLATNAENDFRQAHFPYQWRKPDVYQREWKYCHWIDLCYPRNRL